MRSLALVTLVLVCTPLVAATETDFEALLSDTRGLLDSRIGGAFPDVQLRKMDSRKGTRLSALDNNGLLVIYAQSPCKWAIRAAESMSDNGWEWNGSPVIVVMGGWPKKWRNEFLRDLPDGAPVYRLTDSSPPEWLNRIKVSPLLVLLGSERTVLDWAVAVPGDDSFENVPILSRLGSLLGAEPPNKRMQTDGPPARR